MKRNDKIETGGMNMKKVIKIDGMGCEHCIKSVKEALASLSDIQVIDVKIGEARIEIPENYEEQKIKDVLDDAGYDVV